MGVLLNLFKWLDIIVASYASSRNISCVVSVSTVMSFEPHRNYSGCDVMMLKAFMFSGQRLQNGTLRINKRARSLAYDNWVVEMKCLNDVPTWNVFYLIRNFNTDALFADLFYLLLFRYLLNGTVELK